MDDRPQHVPTVPADAQADRAQVVRDGRLVEATPEVLAEVAESAMLLSQGSRRAIEMKREAEDAAVRAASAKADQAA
jgi:hypothetical protein